MGGQNSSQNLEGYSTVEEQQEGEGGVREAEMEQQLNSTENDIRREQNVLETKLVGLQLNMCLMNGKKKLKEINELVKLERAKLTLICEKSYVQKNLEITNLQLLHQRESVDLLLRQLEEAKQTEQQTNAVVSETSIATVQTELVAVRENIHILEGHEMTLSKQLDAINTLLDSNEDVAIIASANDSRTAEMPTEELTQKNEELVADMIKFERLSSDTQQKIDAFNEIWRREQENHELKLGEIQIDVHKSKKTLKELGEDMKRETVNLERILRKKQLKVRQEGIAVQLVHLRVAESLLLRKIGFSEEVEAFYREKYGGGNEEDERELQKLMVFQREWIGKHHNELSSVRMNLRGLEKHEMSIGEQLDAINKEIEDTSLSTSVTGNSPSAPPSSSSSPPSERQKVISSSVEGESKEEEETEEEEEEEDREVAATNAKVKKEMEERRMAFEEHVREVKADLQKRAHVIVDLDTKMAELGQQFRDMGAIGPDNKIRTNLTATERQLVEPMRFKYVKYEKLHHSLAMEHDHKHFGLQVELMVFNTKAYETSERAILRDVDTFENLRKGDCDAEHRQFYEQQLLLRHRERTRIQAKLVEFANLRAYYEQKLVELAALEEQVRSAPPIPPPPPVEKDPMTLLLEVATARAEREREAAGSAAGTAASPEDKAVKNRNKNDKSKDTRLRPESTPYSAEEQQTEDMDEDATDAAAASSTAASRKKKKNKKKGVKGDAQPPASTDEPSEETTAADIVPSDQPSEAKEVTPNSESNEATAPLQLQDVETTTAVVPAAAALGEDDKITPTVVAATALPSVDVEHVVDTVVEEKKEGKKGKKSSKSAPGSLPAVQSTVPSSPATTTTATEAVAEGGVVPDTSAVVAAQSPASPARAPSKPASTSTNSPKSTSTSTSTPTKPKPNTPKPSPAPAVPASATPPPSALVPLGKVLVKPEWGMTVITKKEFCSACRDLEQAKTKGREIVSYFPRGFTNTGNACYRNAVLQSLLASPPLIRLLSALSDNAEHMPDSMDVWREVLTLTGELSKEPPPQVKKTPPVASSTSSGQAGKVPDQKATAKPQAAKSQGAATKGSNGATVGGGRSQSGASSGGGSGAINVLGGDTLIPDVYFVKTFVDFRTKMSLLRGEALPPDAPLDNPKTTVVGPGSGLSSVVRPRIPQEDAMEFMTYLLERLNEEIHGEDEESENAAAAKEADNAGWESVSTIKTKIKVKNVVDDASRLKSAKGNAATTVTRLFYGTLRSVVCYPANKSSANKKINSATFQPFSNLNLNITESMELTGPYSLQNFKRAAPITTSGNKGSMHSLSTLNKPSQHCLLPPLTLGRALEGYFQSTPLDEGAYKTIQFEHLPQVLVLQLDRFYYDYNRNVPNKIDRDIRYPMTLELPNNMLSAELIDRLQEEASKEPGHHNNIIMNSEVTVSYSLVAVVRHHGASATSGHYTALCRDNKLNPSSASVGASAAAGSTGTGTTAAGSSKWGWEYDDAKVTAITVDDALQATQTAYILLYFRN